MVVRKVVSSSTHPLIQEDRRSTRSSFHLAHQSESCDYITGREKGMATEDNGHCYGQAPCYWTKEEDIDGGLVCQSLSSSL